MDAPQITSTTSVPSDKLIEMIDNTVFAIEEIRRMADRLKVYERRLPERTVGRLWWKKTLPEETDKEVISRLTRESKEDEGAYLESPFPSEWNCGALNTLNHLKGMALRAQFISDNPSQPIQVSGSELCLLIGVSKNDPKCVEEYSLGRELNKLLLKYQPQE